MLPFVKWAQSGTDSTTDDVNADLATCLGSARSIFVYNTIGPPFREYVAVESLLIVVLVILILLLVLVVFIPAYLERLSRTNRRKRDENSEALRALERDARRVERHLAPYTDLRAVAYRDGVATARRQLADLKARLATIHTAIGSLRCPEVFDYLFPVQHFVLVPNHVGAILSDARRLEKIRSDLAEGSAALNSVRKTVDSLGMLPQRLSAEQAALAERLARLDSAIEQERAQGIEALGDLTREATVVRQLLSQWERAVATNDSLRSLDDGARALEAASATLSDLEGRATALEQERTALDGRLRRAIAELDDVQATIKAGPDAADGLPQVRPLLRRAAALLNESAMAHRRRREFAAAGADLAAAARLTTLARDLSTANRQAKLLEARDDGITLAEAITGLRRELAELLDRLGEEAIDGASALADAGLTGRAAQLRTRADNLTRRQDEIIAGLERDAGATLENLERGWNAGQHLLRLADDDPLVRRHARLLEAYEAAKRQPAALDQFRREATEFERVWEHWVTRVQSTRALIGRLRADLPGLIDEALSIAAPWDCLSELVISIQQRAADFETVQAHFAATHHRREAESLMEQLETIERDVQERFAQLNERAARLNFLETDINQVVALAAEGVNDLPAEHPDQQKWDRAMRIIDHHLGSAHAARHYEDASVALLRASETANKLAL